MIDSKYIKAAVAIKDYLDPEIQSYYKEHVEMIPDDEETSLVHYIAEQLEFNLNKENSSTQDEQETLIKIQKKNKDKKRKQKKYWITNMKNDVFDELNTMKSLKLSKAIGFENINLDDYKKKRIDEINEWGQDKNSYLFDFPFFFKKTEKTQIKSFLLELTINSINIIMEHFKGSIAGCLTTFPTDLISYPFFSPTSSNVDIHTKTKKDMTADVTTYMMLYSTYQTDDVLIETGLGEITDKDQLAVISELKKDQYKLTQYLLDNNVIVSLKDWDSKDKAIIEYFYNHLTSAIVSDRKYQTTLGNIARYALNTQRPSSKQLKDIEERLHKLVGKTNEIKLLGKNGEVVKHLTYTLFPSVLTDKTVTQQTMVTIEFSSSLIDAYINNKSTQILTSMYAQIPDQKTSLIAMIIHVERLKAHANKKNYATIPFSHFASRLKDRISDTRFQKYIFDSLDKLIELGIIVKSYKKNEKSVSILFEPLNNTEIFLYDLNSDENETSC